MVGAWRCRTRLGALLVRWALTAAVWIPLMVARWLDGSAVPSSSRKLATAGRKADCRRGIRFLGPGSWVTRAWDG